MTVRNRLARGLEPILQYALIASADLTGWVQLREPRPSLFAATAYEGAFVARAGVALRERRGKTVLVEQAGVLRPRDLARFERDLTSFNVRTAPGGRSAAGGGVAALQVPAFGEQGIGFRLTSSGDHGLATTYDTVYLRRASIAVALMRSFSGEDAGDGIDALVEMADRKISAANAAVERRLELDDARARTLHRPATPLKSTAPKSPVVF